MRTKRQAAVVSDFRYRPLVAALSLALGAGEAIATTKTVTFVGDRTPPSPTIPGSLRAAIEFFNIPANCTGADLIDFSSNGPFVVNVSDPLPIITCGGLTIDGLYTLVGSSPAATSNARLNQIGSASMNGLQSSTATPVTVRNMQVYSFSYGSALLGNINALDNELVGNNIGYENPTFSGNGTNELQVTGNTATSNFTGIRIGEDFGPDMNHVVVSGNTVSANQNGIYVSYGGSTTSVANNAVTGNLNPTSFNASGIYLEWSRLQLDNNHVAGNNRGVYIEADQGSQITSNRIGTTDDGLNSQANDVGIVFGSSSSDTSFDTLISGNTISANDGYGIDLSDFQDVTITGNKIGTRIDGFNSLPNGNGGILAGCGSGIEVTNNVISGNSGPGIEFSAVQGGGSAQLNIVDNKIGVMGDGFTALGNSSYGVLLSFGTCSTDFGDVAVAKKKGGKGRKVAFSSGSNDNLVRNNIVANNSDHGIVVRDDGGLSGVRNKIVANKVYGNTGKNINLGAFGGPRPNDPTPPVANTLGDTDTGPNNGQNYPVITTLVRDWPAAKTVVNFTLDTAPGLYRIDMYSNGTTASPGGKTYHGFGSFTTATGPTTGSVDITGLAVGSEPNNVSLTATGPFSSVGDMDSDSIRRDTSEFSPVAFLASFVDVTITPNPPNLEFGQVSIGTQSPQQSITLLSSGNAPYRIFQIRQNTCSGPLIYGGSFMIASTCQTNHNYVPGESCQITARFAPNVLGSASQDIAVCDNTFVYGGRHFTLHGTGVTPPPVTVKPSEFDFGSVLAGSKSEPQQFVIDNPGTSTVSIGPVTLSNGEFVIDSTTCGNSIPGGSFCTAMASFAPSQPGHAEATLSVAASTSSAGSSTPAVKIRKVTGGSASAHLTGDGVQRADIQLPPFIDFGAYTLGTPPLHQNVEIINTGNAVVSFQNISVSGPFTLSNGCPLSIAPGEHCTIGLDFLTTTLGDFTGTLSVVSNATGGTRTIALTARALALPVPQLAVSPSTMSFGDRLLGTTSGTQRVTIRNIGAAPAVITSITLGADFVVLGNTCTLPLAPTSTCFADVALRPVGFGPRSSTLFVNSNTADSPNVVGLAGTGCRPFSSSSSRFGVGSGFNCAP